MIVDCRCVLRFSHTAVLKGFAENGTESRWEQKLFIKTDWSIFYLKRHNVVFQKARAITSKSI